jgi:hypothetical protein
LISRKAPGDTCDNSLRADRRSRYSAELELAHGARNPSKAMATIIGAAKRKTGRAQLVSAKPEENQTTISESR